MTFVLTVQTKGSIWMVSDRRLSAPGCQPIDDAVKMTFLEVQDGLALLGYAGLGATALGQQPSQWVSNVLRGRHHPLEEMLSIIANAMMREFLPHLSQIQDVRQRQHRFLVPAYVGTEHRVYTIDLAHTKDGWKFRYTRHIMGGVLLPLQITMPFGVAGSGSRALLQIKDWQRPLLHVVDAYNRNKVNATSVSDFLARICYKVHQNTADGSVGPRSIVAWRNSKIGAHKFGSGHFSYTGNKRESQSPALPNICSGMDMAAIVGLLMEEIAPGAGARLDAAEKGQQLDWSLDQNKLNERLAKLPHTPDEKLR